MLTKAFSTATVYDTSDPDTRSNILSQIRKIRLSSPVLTDSATPAAPQTVKVGFVFCQFQNVQDSDKLVTTEYQKLIGFNSGTNKNELSDFINTQSNGRVNLDLVYHASWVTLAGKYEDYQGQQDKIVKELDQKHEFDNSWQVAIIAFPEKYAGDAGTFFKETSGTVLAGSYCSNGCKVDEDQNTHLVQTVNLIFLDPSVFNEKRPHYTTIHEVLHALGLPDLYNATVNRSFGWSVMSDCRQGWQLTGFEKLALGWDSVDNYLFLKNGALTNQVISKQSAASGIKGVIVLPEDNGTKEDFYTIEIPQQLGDTSSSKKDCANTGLLVMVAKPVSGQGSISPFVKSSNSDNIFGGASNAPFGQGTQCSTNGISITDIGLYNPTNNNVQCTISVAENYTNPSSATQLRENERLQSGTWKFMLDITGNLTLGGLPCIYNNALLNLSGDLFNKGYGFCAYVDRNGVFTLAAETEANKSNAVIVKKFDQGIPSDLSTGDYFFKLEVIYGVPQIAIYQGNVSDANPTFKYCLFQYASVFAPKTDDYVLNSGTYHLNLQKDGNLALYTQPGQTGWKWSYFQGTGSAVIQNAIKAIVIDQTGQMTWADSNGTAVKSFPGKGGLAPFSLALDSSNPANIYLLIKDATGIESQRILLDDSIHP